MQERNVYLHSDYFFASLHTCIEMMRTNIQATNYPYPTTNTPSLTIHHTLIVCEALRCVCPCDDDRDAKEDDCKGVSLSHQFSRKQLRNATIVLRRQKPLTNALDGLYVPRVVCMLEARWVEGLCHCRGVHMSDGKAAGGFPSPAMV